MSLENYLFNRYYDICNTINLTTCDHTLLDAINFYKYGNKKFKNYLDNNKIAITHDLYEHYVDLDVYDHDEEEVEC